MTETDPRPPAVTFVTTEHFVLRSRAATIAESTGRANIFLASVSGGLVALGLVATASRVGTAFYAVGLVLLPTLAFVGLVTFERVLQSGIETRDMPAGSLFCAGITSTTRPSSRPTC